MNTLRKIGWNDAISRLSNAFLNIVEMLCQKYLFFTVLINTVIVSKPLLMTTITNNDMYMYYTAETTIIGNRPCRFWGLLSGLYTHKSLFTVVVQIMYFASAVLLSFIIYQFLKRISEINVKLYVLFIINVNEAMFFYCTCRPLLSLTMMYSFCLWTIALYIMMYKSNYCIYLSSPLLILSLLFDVRIVPLSILSLLLLLHNQRSLNKNISKIIWVTIIELIITFIFSYMVSNDNIDLDEINKYYETFYNIEDVENNSFLSPESLLYISGIDLISEWFLSMPNTLLCFIFKEIFQGLFWVYIPLIIIYNQLTSSND